MNIEGQWRMEGGLSRNTCKWIAMVTMLIDHVAAALLNPWLSANPISSAWWFWGWMNYGMRTIGRLAFPIYAFFLVEGFLYTRNRRRYAVRLLVLAFLSEIPFDMALHGNWIVWEHQNTVFLLLLGLGMMEGMSRVSSFLVKIIILICTMTVSIVLRLDYSAFGIMLIAIFYLFYPNRRTSLVCGGTLWFFETMSHLGAGAVACVLLKFYNGKKQPNTKTASVFYLFYPLHLCILSGLRLLMSALQ